MVNKYIYEHILQGNYGYGDGWEDLCCEDTYSEILARLKEYRENEGGHYRTIVRRSPNPAWRCTQCVHQNPYKRVCGLLVPKWERQCKDPENEYDRFKSKEA